MAWLSEVARNKTCDLATSFVSGAKTCPLTDTNFTTQNFVSYVYCKTLERISSEEARHKEKDARTTKTITGGEVGGACLMRCDLKYTGFIHFPIKHVGRSMTSRGFRGGEEDGGCVRSRPGADRTIILSAWHVHV